MRYLFFDIECANCFNGQGKICSFGYCIVDENFNVLEVQDILINPKSKFNLGPKNKEPSIQLGYTKNKFNKSPDFHFRYPEIKKLLEAENQVVFGHSVGNDLSFILADCKRYRMPAFYIKAFDTQAIYKQITGEKNDAGLSSLCERYNINTENLHRSDCDAMMTMNVLKGICKEKDMTITQLLNEYPKTYVELKDDGVHKVFEPIKNSKKLSNLNRDLFDLCHTKKGHPLIKLVAFDDYIEENEYQLARAYVSIINHAGIYAYTSRLPKANFYVMKDENSAKSMRAKARLANAQQKQAKLKILTEKEFIKKFNIDEELIAKHKTVEKD